MHVFNSDSCNSMASGSDLIQSMLFSSNFGYLPLLLKSHFSNTIVDSVT